MKTKATYFKIFLDMTSVILVMYFNISHLSQVYYNVTLEHYSVTKLAGLEFESKWLMVIFDIAIIGFILTGRKMESAIFTFIVFVLNLIFYKVAINISNAHSYDIDKLSSISASIILSGAFSYLIHRKSVSLINLMYGFDNMEQAGATIQTLVAANEQKDEVLKQKKAKELAMAVRQEELEAANILLSKNNNAVEKDLTCSCGYIASIENGLATALKSINAHKGVCNKVGSLISATP